jgi:hypothetical protein
MTQQTNKHTRTNKTHTNKTQTEDKQMSAPTEIEDHDGVLQFIRQLLNDDCERARHAVQHGVAEVEVVELRGQLSQCAALSRCQVVVM